MASRGQTAQLSQMYVADFETCDSVQSDDRNVVPDQRVWLAGYMDLQTMTAVAFNNLDDFMTSVLGRGDNNNREIAYHNLKFDGSFIIPWLFKYGYAVSYTSPEPGEFSVLVDERNQWYSIKIQVNSKRHVLFWDSLKLFPMPLEYLPDLYHTPTHKVQESEDFYTAYRPEGYEPTDRDMAYFIPDLKVLAETLNAHIALYGLRFKRTQASQAFANFEQVFPAWKMRFPGIDTQIDNLIRPSYWGGISYVPPEYAGKDFYDIRVYDINSSYPYQAANKPLPYGHVSDFEEHPSQPKMNQFWIAEALIEFTVKPHHIPCIPGKGIVEGRPITTDKWLHDSGGVVRLRFCSIDYVTMAESYDIRIISWEWVLYWKHKVHSEVAKFVNMNNAIKVNCRQLAKNCDDPIERIELLIKANRAKIDNNAFYGKFGEEIVKKSKMPHYKKEEPVKWTVDKFDEMTMYKRKFIPVAIAITAYGRQQLVRFANLLGPGFLYCDTDSVHYLKSYQSRVTRAQRNKIIHIHPVELGAWSHEDNFDRGRYLRSKCYAEENSNGMQVTLAGLPADPHSGMGSKSRSCITWDNFHIGAVIPSDKSNKLATVRTKTGDKLVPTHFTIKQTDLF